MLLDVGMNPHTDCLKTAHQLRSQPHTHSKRKSRVTRSDAAPTCDFASTGDARRSGALPAATAPRPETPEAAAQQSGATAHIKLLWLSNGGFAAAVLGAMTLGARWAWVAAVSVARAILGFAAGSARHACAPVVAGAEAPEAALGDTALADPPAPKARNGRSALCGREPAVAATSGDASESDASDDAATSLGDNPFALLRQHSDTDLSMFAVNAAPDKSFRAPAALARRKARRPRPSPTLPRSVAPARVPAPEPAALRVRGWPRKCQISKSVASRAGGSTILHSVMPVPVFDNAVLDAILEGRLGDRGNLAFVPGDTFLRGTRDGGRYEFEVIVDNAHVTELYQYAMHYDHDKQGLIRINKRRVVVTW